jgi:hypothetical protein
VKGGRGGAHNCRQVLTPPPHQLPLLLLLPALSENNSIVLLNIRANQLTGPATAVEDCGNLVQLDISKCPGAGLWQLGSLAHDTAVV